MGSLSFPNCIETKLDKTFFRLVERLSPLKNNLAIAYTKTTKDVILSFIFQMQCLFSASPSMATLCAFWETTDIIEEVVPKDPESGGTVRGTTVGAERVWLLSITFSLAARSSITIDGLCQRFL